MQELYSFFRETRDFEAGATCSALFEMQLWVFRLALIYPPASGDA